MAICKNCSTNFDTKFCPSCGVPAQVSRIDRRYVLHEIQHAVLHFEKGFLYTIKELITRPGISIREFVQGDRTKHYKPIGFVVVTSLIYIFVMHFLHFNELAATNLDKNEIIQGNSEKLFTWVRENYNYSNLISILFSAIALKLFFRKKGYNYFEYLVLLCYLTGIGMLFLTVVIMLLQIVPFKFGFSIFSYVVIIYMFWGIGQFVGGKAKTYFKALLAYLIGLTLLSVFLLIIGGVLDLVKIKL
jgi:hypothetical protein